MGGSEAADTTPFRAFREELLDGSIQVNPFYDGGDPELIGAVLAGRFRIQRETRMLPDGGTLTVRSVIYTADFNNLFSGVVLLDMEGSDYVADKVCLVAKVDSPTLSYMLDGEPGTDGKWVFEPNAHDADLSFSLDPESNPSLAKLYAATALYGLRCHVEVRDSHAHIENVDVDFAQEDI
jgi:hypothetical protein